MCEFKVAQIPSSRAVKRNFSTPNQSHIQYIYTLANLWFVFYLHLYINPLMLRVAKSSLTVLMYIYNMAFGGHNYSVN